MKVANIFNSALRRFGVKLVRLSTLHQMQQVSVMEPSSDIHTDEDFMRLFNKVEKYTMTGIERCYALYKSLQFIHANNIAGDLVECGVWRGGSCMLMANYLQSIGDVSRKIYLYDTFEGMTQPGDADGEKEKQQWERHRTTGQSSQWCFSSLEEVRQNLHTTRYPEQNLIYVKGKVEDTIPQTTPFAIALLRLDTDWYSSTQHELRHLFPLLTKKGILIIDDYGVWKGAKKATDEYFANQSHFLHRIDHSGIMIINH